MKFENFEIYGEIVKNDERYVVADNSELNNLVVSSTKLNPNKSTTGHRHKGQEEVYIFVKGDGVIELDNYDANISKTLKFDVKFGDTVLIHDGVFHRVHAGSSGISFICVFDGRRGKK
jgi:mannose-6-phosphate isomerase-like protein (cupin superfamily)